MIEKMRSNMSVNLIVFPDPEPGNRTIMKKEGC